MATANKTATASENASEDAYTRLHITPFTPALFEKIIPPSVQASAKNTSYHTLQTLPEQGFGYVELPSMEAEKLRKKLNGSILKGAKVRIERAKPAKELGGNGVVDEKEREREERRRVRKELKQAKKEEKELMGKKRKAEEVLEGVELRGRRVKRGWTEPATAAAPVKKDKRSKEKEKKGEKIAVKSKYTGQAECLFRTSLPPNVAAKTAATADDAKKSKREKKSKKGKEVVVHEFEKTTKHATFLRESGVSSETKGVAEFVEGKGWVNEEGDVVETAPVKKRKVVPEKKVVAKPANDSDDSSSASDSTESLEDDASEDEKMAEVEPPKTRTSVAQIEDDSPTSSSGSSSSEEDSDEESEDEEDESVQPPKGERAQESNIGSKMEVDSEASSSESSSEEDSEDEDDQSIKPTKEKIQSTEPAQDENEDDIMAEDSETSTSGSSSDADSDSSSSPEDDSDSEEETTKQPNPAPSHHRTSSSSLKPVPSLSLQIPSPKEETSSTSVHPLEALYKKPKTGDQNTQEPSSFSFFGNDGDGDEEEADTTHISQHSSIPMTPFTQRDFEFRGMRSAAPTPDTAHANKKFRWPSPGEQEEAGSSRGDPPTRKRAAEDEAREEEGEEPKSEFQKWFWENRGEANRAWKKRRKVAAKEKKQREGKKSRG